MNRRNFLMGTFSLVLVKALKSPSALAFDATGSALSPAEVDMLLTIHNTVRTEVGVPALTWSTKLASYAQNWADSLARSGDFIHSAGPYGENLAGADNVEQAVNLWLSEKSLYRGQPITAGHSESGHYSQMVWSKTKKVGCGKAISGDEIIWVCSYDPAGNRRGQTPY